MDWVFTLKNSIENYLMKQKYLDEAFMDLGKSNNGVDKDSLSFWKVLGIYVKGAKIIKAVRNFHHESKA